MHWWGFVPQWKFCDGVQNKISRFSLFPCCEFWRERKRKLETIWAVSRVPTAHTSPSKDISRFSLYLFVFIDPLIDVWSTVITLNFSLFPIFTNCPFLYCILFPWTHLSQFFSPQGLQFLSKKKKKPLQLFHFPFQHLPFGLF